MSESKSTERDESAKGHEPKGNLAENSEPKKGDDDGVLKVQQTDKFQHSMPSRRKRRETRKPLKQSVIRRLCEPHSKRGRSRRSAAAEIMYTNPQFSIDSNIHSCSSFNATQKPTKVSTRRSPSKSRRSAASKAKRQIKTKPRPKTKRRSERLSPGLVQLRDTSDSHQWLCTELNGEIYKVMDLPRGLDDLSCVLLGRPAKKARTRRRVEKRTNYRKDEEDNGKP